MRDEPGRRAEKTDLRLACPLRKVPERMPEACEYCASRAGFMQSLASSDPIGGG